MKFKLNKTSLFFIILGALILIHFSMGIRENFEDSGTSKDTESIKTGVDPSSVKMPKGMENAQSGLGSSSAALPKGIPGSQIPKGDEDLYILKSQVVPPVCPKCPDVEVCPKENNKCPPCPACARCPEPAFECKKVPNYKRKEDNYLPMPILSDFSQFGM